MNLEVQFRVRPLLLLIWFAGQVAFEGFELGSASRPKQQLSILRLMT